ncbi:unnamed protein product [Prunus armeniaca]
MAIDIDDWRQPLPDDSRHRSEVQRRAPRFIYYKKILYRRSFEGVFLRCLAEEDACKAIEEAHSATNYFSKWAEAVPLKEVKKENVVSFIKVNIIHQHGVPRYIITNNGKPFLNWLMDKLCDDFGFKRCNSSTKLFATY